MKRLLVMLSIYVSLVALVMQFSLYASSGSYKESSRRVVQLKEAEMTPEMQAAIDKIFFQSGAAIGGNEFYVCFPPNDRRQPLGSMSIFCGVTKANTKVVIENPQTGSMTYQTVANAYSSVVWTTLNSVTQVIGGRSFVDEDWEVRNGEQLVEERGYRIYVEGPDGKIDPDGEIYVYVGSFREQTAEGYMAIPVTSLGKEYIHCSHLDNDESNGQTNPNDVRIYRTGFVIMAVEDGTKVTVKLRTNGDNCYTSLRQYNDEIFSSPTLYKGQVWNVWNHGANGNPRKGSCDLSGTIIESDKNIGVISYVERTSLPAFARYLSRDCINEQLLPTNYWGYDHISIQLRGNFENTSKTKNNPNPAQFYRVVASEDSTVVSLKWYHLESKQIMGDWGDILIPKKGDWKEIYEQNLIEVDTNTKYPSVSGACVWKANKRVQLLQYQTNCTYAYNSTFLDPLMILIPPFEQYGNNTTFQTAVSTSYSVFTEHYLTLIAKGDSSNIENNISILETITMSEAGNPPQIVGNMSGSNLYNNRVPGTNYYFDRIRLNMNKVYRVEGKTELSGSVYGWGEAISYGWPTSMKLIRTDILDTLAPEVLPLPNCNPPDREDREGKSTLTCRFADTTDIQAPNQYTSPQQDLGLNKAPRVEYISGDDNLKVEVYHADEPNLGTRTTWNFTENIRRGYVRYEIVDKYKDVDALIIFTDQNQNTTICPFKYTADKIKWYENDTNITLINFGTVNIGGSVTKDIIIMNMDINDHIIDLDTIFLSGGNANSGYRIEYETSKKLLEPGEQMTIKLTYEPVIGGNSVEKLIVNTACLYFNIEVHGRSASSQIYVSNIEFGNVLKDGRKDDESLTITNNGLNDLIITGWEFIPDPLSPFSYTPSPTLNFPLTIRPNNSLMIRSFSFAPESVGPFSAKIVFESNAASKEFDPERKDTAFLTGIGVSAGPVMANHNWNESRVLTRNYATLELINGGSIPITVKEIVNSADGWTLGGDTLWTADRSYFVADINNLVGKTIHPSSGGEEPKNLIFNVGFIPQTEHIPYGSSDTLVKFYINFEGTVVTDNTTECILKGKGVLPKINVTGYNFRPTSPGSQDTGYITIENPSETADLYIESISMGNANQEVDFNPLPSDTLSTFSGTIISRAGNPLNPNIKEIYFEFSPGAGPPNRLGIVNIRNDAAPGPEWNPIITTVARLMAYNESLLIGEIDYGMVARCSSPLANLPIINESPTNETRITSITVEAEYADLFDIVTPLPLTILPNGQANIQVRFYGNRSNDFVSAKVTIVTDVSEYKTTFEANPVIIPVTVSLREFTNQLPGDVVDFPIEIKIDNTSDPVYSFQNADIRSFKIVLFAGEGLKSIHCRNVPNNQPNGWTFGPPIQDIAAGTITITGSGSVPITGLLCVPQLLILVSTKNIPIEILSVTFNDKDSCIEPKFKNGKIEYVICAEEIREMEISDIHSSISPIENPFTGSVLDIKYSVAFDAHTELNIYNSNGEIVRNVLDGFKSKGDHKESVNIHNISSGVYIIKMKSGNFEANQNLIILR